MVRSRRKKGGAAVMPHWGAVALLALSSSSATLADQCLPLKGSTQCSAFNQSSISTGSSLTAIYPFLAFVSDVQQFDSQLSQYINNSYVQSRFQQLLGCDKVSLSNTTSYYARYTTSVICNAIVQNSISPCALSGNASRPLCAESCAQQATSEEGIAVNSQLCGTARPNFMDQIRADFTNCALPSNSLSIGCINAEVNEPTNCGFSTSLQGLCGFCATSSPNATDSCCAASNVTSRCPGVTLPTTTSLPPLFPSNTSSPSNSSHSSAPAVSHHGLTKGQLAGIIVGSVLGALLLLALLLLCCILLRRRRGSQASVFNQPQPQRRGRPSMAYTPQTAGQALPPDYGPQPGGRVARMSALEGNESSNTPSYEDGAFAGAVVGGKKHGESPESQNYQETPESRNTGPPAAGKRNGSLSSQSALGALDDYSSPNTDGHVSSPDGVASGQSEQLPFFKDYYSHDEIHPNDKVSVLWAYAPRAADEFELERGEMLKVVGIWDDGWATGVRIGERAEEFDPKHRMHRDSGVSNTDRAVGARDSGDGELKAFPLVCVCLPEYWKQTVAEDQGPEHDV